MDASRTGRTSELYHKSRSVRSTEEEKEEQARLCQEHVAAMRGSFRNSLSNIFIKEPDGSITDLRKKHGGIKEV